MRRRAVVDESEVGIARHQPRKVFFVQADHGDLLGRQDREEQRRHIRAGGDVRRVQSERLRRAAEELGIKQAQPGGIV